MNPSERFFAKLRKLTVYLETESNYLLHTSQNLKDDDGKLAVAKCSINDPVIVVHPLTVVCGRAEDEENGAQALYQLHSEVRTLKVGYVYAHLCQSLSLVYF